MPKRENKKEPIAIRFWRKVAKTSVDACWPWNGSRKHFYGLFYINRKQAQAHRVAWELTFGKITSADLFVCHRCDNPPCVNPAHLFLGTASDNNRDKDEKGRGVSLRGEKSGSSKLTEAQARDAKYGGKPVDQLAREFSVTPGCIHNIRSGVTWKWL
jgi:hypothetical protein